MSSSLQNFFTEQAAAGGLSFYRQKPILQVEVPGIVGKLNKKSDAKGDFFEVSLMASGQNSEYPKGTELQSATVRESSNIDLWMMAGNNLTLGRGKQLLGFAALETDLNVIDRYARLTKEIPYPNHKVLGLSIAFLEGGKISYMLGQKLGIPQSVKNDPEWQRSDRSARCTVEIS